MQIRGLTQILAGSVPWSAMAAGAIVPTNSLVDGANFLKRDGSVAVTANFDFGNQRVVNLANGVAATDASCLAPHQVRRITGATVVHALALSPASQPQRTRASRQE